MKLHTLFVAAVILTVSMFAEASVMRRITQPTNVRLASLVQVLAPDWNERNNCYKLAMAKVITPTEARGRSPEELRYSMVKESLHRFSGAYLDEVIEMSIMRSSSQLNQTLSNTWLEHDEERRAHKLDVLSTETGAMTSETSLVVYAGAAGGNNTSADIISVFDTANSEIISFISSNFASDSDCGDSAN